MSQDQTSANRALHYNTAVDLGALQPRLLALAEQAATAAFSAPNMMEALAKGLDEVLQSQPSLEAPTIAAGRRSGKQADADVHREST